MSLRLIAAVLAALSAPGWAAEASDPVALRAGDGLAWRMQRAHGDGLLRVADDAGRVREFVLGPQLQWSPRAAALPDGNYRYELSIAPPGAPADRRHTPDSVERPGGALASGHFVLRGGAVAAPESEAGAAKANPAAVYAKDQLIPDDLIVQGGVAVGFDAVNNHDFGGRTINLVENNVRLGFDDTSPATEPDVDWELTANAQPSGGPAYFGFQQRSSARTLVSLMAGAPTGSFWIDPRGWLSLGAGEAQQHVHLREGDEAGIRFAQDTSGGFAAQTWDLVADETGFALRDALAGTAPLRIESGAPTGTLTLDAGRRLGLGTPEPQATLHLRRSDGAARLRVEETHADDPPRVLALLSNRGVPRFSLQDSAGGWTLQGAASFDMASTAPAGGAMQLAANGDLTISGTISQGSSRRLKHAIQAAAPAALLERVRALPVYVWQYLGDAQGARHLGPMAEDVHAAFGFGGSERALAPGDVAAIAMTAAQALREELAARDAELERLIARLEALEAAARGAR